MLLGQEVEAMASLAAQEQSPADEEEAGRASEEEEIYKHQDTLIYDTESQWQDTQVQSSLTSEDIFSNSPQAGSSKDETSVFQLLENPPNSKMKKRPAAAPEANPKKKATAAKTMAKPPLPPLLRPTPKCAAAPNSLSGPGTIILETAGGGAPTTLDGAASASNAAESAALAQAAAAAQALLEREERTRRKRDQRGIETLFDGFRTEVESPFKHKP